jgi:hypothetical protein
MSLVSIYKNKDKIKKYYDSIDTDSDILDLGEMVFSDCILKQYEMMRKNLNKNMLDKRHFAPYLTGYSLVDALYQHIFMHNYTALNDEYGEIAEAMLKCVNNKDDVNMTFSINKNEIEDINNKYFMSRLLTVEETIDAFHFILEYIILIEELYHIIVCTDVNTLKVSDLDFIYTNCEDYNVFYNEVKEMLVKEATHISRDILSNIDSLHKQEYYDNFESICYNNMFVNRNLIRLCNFKDWKEYNIKDFYTQTRFGNMFDCTRSMMRNLFEIIVSNLNNFSAVGEMIGVSTENTNQALKLLYSIYLAKRDENIRRQKEDPRYKIKATGNIVGDRVS